jgi:hypothetical protein
LVGPETFGVSQGFYQNMILLVVVMVCLLMVALVVNDMLLGVLTFSGFMSVVAAFIRGMGAEGIRKRRQQNDSG